MATPDSEQDLTIENFLMDAMVVPTEAAENLPSDMEHTCGFENLCKELQVGIELLNQAYKMMVTEYHRCKLNLEKATKKVVTLERILEMEKVKAFEITTTDRALAAMRLEELEVVYKDLKSARLCLTSLVLHDYQVVGYNLDLIDEEVIIALLVKGEVELTAIEIGLEGNGTIMIVQKTTNRMWRSGLIS
ncbi:hypothetical protein ANCCAN_18573 [Ancylostoma caninum]|uniref:Uncharacterized protein n=1 Tax=Ancylostoma caninum TaxID=29170 RepID=A0A368FZ26_ANCCA|nr:hypothetical protein ANCCAN_18573 [Ancylostoma caninum]